MAEQKQHKGIVSEISVKDGAKGQYHKLKVGNRTFNLFSGTYDGDVNELMDCEIEFSFFENPNPYYPENPYKSIVKDTLKVLKKEPETQSPKPYNDREMQIFFGMVFNKTCEYCTKQDLNLSGIRGKFDEVFDTFWEAGLKKRQEKHQEKLPNNR